MRYTYALPLLPFLCIGFGALLDRRHRTRSHCGRGECCSACCDILRHCCAGFGRCLAGCGAGIRRRAGQCRDRFRTCGHRVRGVFSRCTASCGGGEAAERNAGEQHALFVSFSQFWGLIKCRESFRSFKDHDVS